MLSGPAQIGWETHGPRIIKETFKTKKRKIKTNIIQFHNQLQNILEGYAEKDVRLLIGDFNAKVGADNTGYEEMIGNAPTMGR